MTKRFTIHKIYECILYTRLRNCWNCNARGYSRIYIVEDIFISKVRSFGWLYRRRFQRRVTSRCRRGPIVCWRNTSVSGVPRIDLRTGSCNHPRSSTPPSQFTLKLVSRVSFVHISLSLSLFLFLSLYLNGF